VETPFGTLSDRHLGRLSMEERHEVLHRPSRRRFLAQALVGAGIAAGGPVLWRQTGWAATPTVAPHLQYGRDPQRELVVSWSTDGPVAGAVLDVGADPSFGRVVPAESRAVAGTNTVYHHARVDGLDPGQTYHYRPRHDGATGEPGTFRTAPDTAEPFTFTAFGDQGITDGAVATTALVAAQNPAFHLHVGDLCYAYSAGSGGPGPTDQAVWDQWLSMTSGTSRAVPWMPAIGNHEMENGYGPQGYDGFLGRFTLPGTGPVPTVYAFRYGNLAVLALDGNDASYEITANRDWTGGAQDAWLAGTLAGLRADPTLDWIVVGYHHCSYCTNAVHASDGGPRERWGALFDEHQVDLVVNGHNHCYERTHPLRAGAATAEAPAGATVEPSTAGTTYVTAGGGGQAAYQASLYPGSYVTDESGARVPEPAPWSAARYLDLSILAADVTPPGAGGVTTMTLRALAVDGQEIERVTLLRRATPAPGAGSEAPVVAGAAARPDEPVTAGSAPARALPATGGGTPLAVPTALLAGAGALAALRARAATQPAEDRRDA